MLIKRIMFEEITDNIYTVLFGDNIEGNDADIEDLLEEYSTPSIVYCR
jgi:hypothetical protein